MCFHVHVHAHAHVYMYMYMYKYMYMYMHCMYIFEYESTCLVHDLYMKHKIWCVICTLVHNFMYNLYTKYTNVHDLHSSTNGVQASMSHAQW